jgi:uncharacterized protein (TIGR03000 family)
MHTLVLLMALTASADAPDYYPCGGYSYGGCYSYGGGYSYGGCYSYGGGYSYGGCYTMGGYGVGSYSQSYSKAPDETEEEFAFCQEKAKEMTPEVYSNFRNSVWLRMTNSERSKMMEKEGKGKKGGKKGGTDDDTSSLDLRARIVVTLPADARLTIDDTGTRSDGTRRVFVSPPLQQDRSYSYTFKAEFVREGKTVSVTKKAGVSAGKETLVSFENNPQTDVASR